MNNIIKTTVLAGCAAMLGSASLIAQDAAVAVPAPAQESSYCYMPSVDKLSASLNVGYEGAHVFRGKTQSKDGIQASADIGYAITDAFGIYAGFWNNAPISGTRDFNESDITAGVTYGIAGFILDAGYTFYWFNGNNPARTADTHEIKFGVAYDTAALIGDSLGGVTIVPSAYYFYNFDRMANYVELAISSSLPVGKWAFDKDFLSVDLSVFYGYTTSDRNPEASARTTNSYMYVGATADLVWRLNDICSIRGGIRWTGNDDGDKYGANQNGYTDSQIWWGVSACIGF